jgi:hypothetical protein
VPVTERARKSPQAGTVPAGQYRLLTEDPPLPCAQISARHGILAGNIGPSRSRCLDKLRHYPAVAAPTGAEAARVTKEPPEPAAMP